MAERRLERVGQMVQAELARLLLTAVKDPRLREVTITGVRMSADLRHARVWFRTLGDPQTHDAVQKGLERASGFLRGEVGRALGMRNVPDFRWEWDDTPETARRVEDLLRAAGTPPSARPPRDDDGEDA